MSVEGIAILIAASSAVFTLLSALFVLGQVAWFKRQLKFDALVQIKNVNRELILLGFKNPELFKALHGNTPSNEATRRYYQLWINQIELVYNASRSKLLNKEFQAATERDIADFLAIDSVIEFWKESRRYYSNGFRDYVQDVLGRRNERRLS